MNDAVVANDIGGDNFGVVNLDALGADGHGDFSAVKGLHFLAI